MKRKINILHLIQSCIVGGAEVLLVHYIKALGNDKYNHYVYNIWADGPISQKLKDLGIQVVIGPKREYAKNPLKFFFWLVKLTRHLSTFIDANKIDVIRSDLNLANLIALFIGKIKKLPVFPTVHSTMAFVDKRSIFDPRRHILKIANRLFYPLAEQVIAVSPEVKDIIKQHIKLKDSRITVVKNGILFEKTNENVIYPSIGQTKSMLTFISVGSLDWEKGFDVLIMAVNEVLQQGYKNIKFIIAGEGKERQKLQSLIQKFNISNHVKLLGLRHDVIHLMKQSDVFVMPSRYEGLSIAMIEAMACGLPVIVSNAPGFKDWIKNEQNGLIFPVDDYQSLAKCLIRLISNPDLRRQLQNTSKATFEKEFNLKKNIVSFENLINNIRYRKLGK